MQHICSFVPLCVTSIAGKHIHDVENTQVFNRVNIIMLLAYWPYSISVAKITNKLISHWVCVCHGLTSPSSYLLILTLQIKCITTLQVPPPHNHSSPQCQRHLSHLSQVLLIRNMHATCAICIKLLHMYQY